MPLESITAKFERAKEHIGHLNSEVGLFLQRNPYRQSSYDDPDTGDHVVELQIIEGPPPRLLAILGDAIHNLRACLDYLAGDFVVANGGTPDRNTAFPICDRAEDIDRTIARNIRGASDEIVRMIKGLNPHEGGDGLGDALWRLHRLDIVDKHRLLITTATCIRSISIGPSAIPLGDFFPDLPEPRTLPPKGVALKHGAVLLRTKRANLSPMHMDPEFQFQIAFGEIVEGKPLIPQLMELLNLVDRVVPIFHTT